MQNDPYVIPANQRDRLPDAGGVDAGSRRPTEPIEYADLGNYYVRYTCRPDGSLRTTYHNDLRSWVEEQINAGSRIAIPADRMLIDNPENCPNLEALRQRMMRGDDTDDQDAWETDVPPLPRGRGAL
jgi:hypothetical protein